MRQSGLNITEIKRILSKAKKEKKPPIRILIERLENTKKGKKQDIERLEVEIEDIDQSIKFLEDKLSKQKQRNKGKEV